MVLYSNGGRFHEAYIDNKDTPFRMEMAAEMVKYGVKAGWNTV